jgi:CHAD domain-containing protein
MTDKALSPSPIPLAQGLRAAARDILADAHKVLEDPLRSEAEAVHDFRKAMKRWRALLRLLSPYLADGGALRMDARDIARRLTASRDNQAALEALADLAKHNERGLSARTQQNLRMRLSGAAQQTETLTLTSEMRDRLRASLLVAADSIERWPLEQLTFRDVADRLTSTYRRARRLLPEAWAGADPEHLHELRKRVVEHRYQMELIEPLWPRLIRVWVEEAQRLRERLGRCQDLEVLRRTVEPHRPLAPWRSRVTPLIAARRSSQTAAAARIAARLFAEKPKAFRRRIQSLWEQTTEQQTDPTTGKPVPADSQPVSGEKKTRIGAKTPSVQKSRLVQKSRAAKRPAATARIRRAAPPT